MRLSTIVFAACLAGCYHPKIKDGTIFCSDDPTPKCPSGMHCAADGLCYARAPMISAAYGDGRVGKQDLTAMTGTLVLHTNTGQITLHDDTAGTDAELVAASAQPFGTAQTGGPPVAIWSFTELNVPPGMPVQVSPDSRAVPVLAATVSLRMSGFIDLSGNGGQNGGANADGVNPAVDGTTDGVGGGGAALSSTAGGGGGGHATAGSMGMGTGGGAPGPSYGGAEVLPVYFGAGGGGGGGATGSSPGLGGTGGGAIALLSPSIILEGVIDVSGAFGGPASAGDAGGGGGGAGGTISSAERA